MSITSTTAAAAELTERTAQFRGMAFNQAVVILEAELAKPNAEAAVLSSLLKVVKLRAKALVEAVIRLGDESIAKDKFLEVGGKLAQLTLQVDTAHATAQEWKTPATAAASHVSCGVFK